MTNRCLFIFDANGNKVQTVENIGSVSNCCGEVVAFGIDQTRIGQYDTRRGTFRTLYTNEPERIRTVDDADRYQREQERRELDALKEKREREAREEFDFLTHRRDQLLDLIECAERELSNAVKFSKEWERLQRKVMTLENQLRANDKKRDQAYFTIHS